MEIILLQKISKLGNIGDTVQVKQGFGRNFLIPSGKALRATKENKEFFQKTKEKLLELNSYIKKKLHQKLNKRNEKNNTTHKVFSTSWSPI